MLCMTSGCAFVLHPVLQGVLPSSPGFYLMCFVVNNWKVGNLMFCTGNTSCFARGVHHVMIVVSYTHSLLNCNMHG